MRRWRTAAATTAAMTALAAVSACTAAEGDDEQTQPPEDEKVRLVDLLNENERLFAELYETEPKVIKVCLEDQGFTVHDEAALHQSYAIGVDQGGLQSDYYGFEEWLPDAELAADWGFGQWLWSSEDFDAIEEYNELLYPDEAEAVQEEYPDNTAFEELPVEDRIAWYEAYLGQEKMEHDDLAWRLRNPDADESEIAERLSETQEDEDDGTIDTEVEIDAPKPGGCELEMIEALYGEPQRVEEEMEEGVEEGLTIYTWKYRPEAPDVPATDWAAVEADTAAVSDAFLSCVADRGFGEWAFQEGGWMPVSLYFELVYRGEVGLPDEEPEAVPGMEEAIESLPELPADLPADFEGKKAYEIEMAVAFSECADEVEYRETVMTAMDAAELEAYQAIETELFTYQDDLRTSLKMAQDMLEA